MSIIVKISPAFKEELNGRLLLFVDRKENNPEPMLFRRSEFGMDGSPVFGVTFYGLHGGDEIDLEEQKEHILGSPFPFEEIPHEKLSFQAFFIRYHRYERKDGHVLWGMKDYGGGGWFAENPFNLYSDVKTATYGRERNIRLTLDHMIEAPVLKKGQVYEQGNYKDHGLVKYFKMKSKLLSDFWGEDMYLGANVLLPAHYDPKKNYPMILCMGHFPGATAPFRYGIELRDREKGFTEYWDSGKAP